MANLPDSLYEDYSRHKLTWPVGSASAPTTTIVPLPDMGTIIQWINDLHNEIPFISDFALQNLVTHRNSYEILPLLLWKSPCTVTMMLQFHSISAGDRENLSTHLNSSTLSGREATSSVQHSAFVPAEMPHYLFPLMDIDLTDKPLEFLRLGALGVLAHMLKAPIDIAAVVRFLMDNGALRYCTKAIETGSTESKIVSVFILNKILSTDEGLQYCCILADRFFLIDGLLKKLLVYLSSMTNPSPSLFNLIAGCYAKLSQKSRAREGLWRFPPVMLLNGTFASLLAEDPDAANYRKQLIRNMQSKAMK
ncbi:hypothetical protein Bca101_042887 [Brassica carinata]